MLFRVVIVIFFTSPTIWYCVERLVCNVSGLPLGSLRGDGQAITQRHNGPSLHSKCLLIYYRISMPSMPL